jgi:hypothetical protein
MFLRTFCKAAETQPASIYEKMLTTSRTRRDNLSTKELLLTRPPSRGTDLRQLRTAYYMERATLPSRGPRPSSYELVHFEQASVNSRRLSLKSKVIEVRQKKHAHTTRVVYSAQHKPVRVVFRDSGRALAPGDRWVSVVMISDGQLEKRIVYTRVPLDTRPKDVPGDLAQKERATAAFKQVFKLAPSQNTYLFSLDG